MKHHGTSQAERRMTPSRRRRLTTDSFFRSYLLAIAVSVAADVVLLFTEFSDKDAGTEYSEFAAM